MKNIDSKYYIKFSKSFNKNRLYSKNKEINGILIIYFNLVPQSQVIFKRTINAPS